MSDSLPILVYQMGKVGSFSIYMSLKEIRETHHVHYLRKDIMERLEKMQTDRGFPVPGHLITSKMVWKEYLDKDLPLKIITLVRDPISRNMSAFFENLNNFIDNSKHEYFSIPEDIATNNGFSEPLIELLRSNAGRSFNSSFDLVSFLNENLEKAPSEDIKQEVLRFCFHVRPDEVQDLIDRFMDKYNHKLPTYWFDVEPKKVLDYDVYAENFPRKKGYKISRLDNGSEILVMKCELSNQEKEDILCKYLGMDSFTIKNHNVGQSKYYQSLYTAFKKKIKLPEAYFEELLSAKFTKFFYSTDEIKQIQSKWNN